MIGESQTVVERDAKDAPVKDVVWHSQEAQTEDVKIQDPGVGQANILRFFFFKKPPFQGREVPRPTKLELINSFKRLIEHTLWADGLIVREDKPLEVYTKHQIKKVSQSIYLEMIRNHADFVIMLLATPRRGVNVNDTISIAK